MKFRGTIAELAAKFEEEITELRKEITVLKGRVTKLSKKEDK